MDKPWKVVLAFLGVFVAGAVFGGLLALRVDRVVSQRRLQEQAAAQAVRAPGQPMPPQAQQRPPPLPVPQAVQSAQLMRRVTNQLNLTPAQRALVTPLIQRAVQDFWRQQQNYSRENAFLLQRLKQDIAKELTPEQQNRLDQLWLRQLEVFRKRQAEAQIQAQNPPRPADGAPPPGPLPPGGEPRPPAPDAQDQPAPAAKPPAGKHN
jgi:hypothetical protein